MIKQRGVALYLALVILAAITAALFALLTIAISQTKIIWSIGDSAIAFYAADTGIEQVLYKVYQEPWTPDSGMLGRCVFPDDPGNDCSGKVCPAPEWKSVSADAEYQVCVSSSATSTIWSTGNHKATKTKRKIEINF